MFKAREHCVRQRTSTQDTANANYMLLTIVVTGHNCVAVRRRRRRRNATCRHVASVYVRRRRCVCVNTAVEINVLDYNVAVRSMNGA